MPVKFLADLGHRVQVFNHDYLEPSGTRLVAAYTAMVIGRQFDIQATALAKQGRLAVYPPSRGQEACHIGSMLAFARDDWAFPTYRDSMALVTRGVDPGELLTAPHGSTHCGLDPRANRTAPQCTQLETQLVHADGFASGERRRGRPTVAMALVGEAAKLRLMFVRCHDHTRVEVHPGGEKTTVELAASLRELTGLARDGKLSPTQMTGGICTLSNYGVFGTDDATPIINYPEVPMLGVGRIIDRRGRTRAMSRCARWPSWG